MKLIKTKEEHESAIAEIERLFDVDPDPDTPDGDQLKILVARVIAYESRHYRILPPYPVEAIKYRLESRGLTKLIDLRRMLEKARDGIEQAITSEDGLDGAEGEDLIHLINRTLNRSQYGSMTDER